MHSREDKSLYFDKRAYANVQAAEAVKSGRMRLDKGNETIEEASKIPVGINSAGQWKVMSKEDMKKNSTCTPTIGIHIVSLCWRIMFPG